jgi:Fe-Mn family superoxide dismutase
MASPLSLDPRPLPFDPAALRGLSERLLRSHHENNYQGALKNLVKTRELLAAVTKDTPGMQVAGLMERELCFRNSVALHELYFGNLGGSGVVGGAISSRLAGQYGSLARWEECFRAAGLSLAGGSGWAVLDLDLRTGELRTYWSGHHTQSLASGLPLLVLDMYEHSYAIDYGAAAAKYFDAFVANVHWDEVDRRLELADQAARLLAG